MFAVSIIPGLILLIGSSKLKESPRWLCKKGLYDQALDSLKANNSPEEAQKIFEEIKENLNIEKAEKMAKRQKANRESLLKKKYILPFILTILVLVLTQATGMNSVLSYSVKIFQQSGMQGEFAN